MKNILFVILLSFELCAQERLQGTAGESANMESSYLIDIPTSGILNKGNVGVSIYLMPDGVTIAKIDAGVFDNFQIGISYGAANFIGAGTPDWYKLPGVNVKVKIFEESEANPAIALGFDSQGKGKFFSKFSDYNSKVTLDNDMEVNRFKIKSPGFFAAVSKNFTFFGYLSLHGVINYSLEKSDRDRNVNISCGIEKTLGNKISILAEYDFALNDNERYSFGDGNGYLNAGLRWSAGDGFTIGIDLRDLLSNKKLNAGSADRAIKVEFIKPIF
jgi:hypothetical protein